jgi:hypothetical protein
MRRFATLVATGAVAAAAAISLAAAPANADTGAVTAKSTFAGGISSGYSAAFSHSWTSHNGWTGVLGSGSYTRTSTGVTVSGYVKDSYKSKYYGALYIKVWAKDLKHYQYVIVVTPKHGVKAYFKTAKSSYNTKLQIAEALAYKSAGKWKLKSVGKFHTFFYCTTKCKTYS